ncbi:MAG: aldehyde dehydrogenase family protein [Thermoplasmatota archaeon]
MTQVTVSEHQALLAELGIDANSPVLGNSDGTSWFGSGPTRDVFTPTDDSQLGTVHDATTDELEQAVSAAHEAFASWRMVPAPVRGELVRRWGEKLREVKEPLGKLVSLEMGKSYQEGLGEVQEMIDICDFAVGLSRQLYGKTMHSERPLHRMYEQWHPLGVVGVISAFNFPVAVYAWNAALALVCGDTIVWKPSEKTPLTAVAVQKQLNDLMAEMGYKGLATLVQGAADPIGEALIHDKRIPLVSATGSCRMGYRVGEVVASRMGRTILELGGNNGIIVAPSADLGLAITGVLFGAVGTAGQRCTSTRRVFLHKSLAADFREKLVKAYGQVKIGDPLDASNHMGPLIDEGAVTMFANAVAAAKDQGAKLLVGGGTRPDLGKCYVEPTVFQVDGDFTDFPLAQEETFAPILYLFEYESLDQVLEWHNGVRQGLSSALFTNDMREMETFLSHAGSDCGIANINIGTSGAEIGGAFGGEKETGGGRESGSDSWKQYMRRQTNTINWGTDLPLAQGIEFDL